MTLGRMTDNDDELRPTVADKARTLAALLAWLRADLTHVDKTYTRENLDDALCEVERALGAVNQIKKDLGTRRRQLDEMK